MNLWVKILGLGEFRGSEKPEKAKINIASNVPRHRVWIHLVSRSSVKGCLASGRVGGFNKQFVNLLGEGETKINLWKSWIPLR